MLPSGRSRFEEPFIQPHIGRIEFREGEVLLDGRFRISGGRLADNAWPFDPLLESDRARASVGLDVANPPAGCSEAREALPEEHGRSGYALACQGARWLFAQAGYCPEGEGLTGRLWLATEDGQTRELRGAIPTCHSPVAGVLHGATAWIGTVRPVEKYDPDDGALLELLLSDDGATTVERHLTGQVVTAVALSPDTRLLWVATRSGLHRLDLENREWERSYFHYRLADDGNGMVLYLSDAPVSANEYGLWAALLRLPILDRRRFVESWHAAPPVASWYSYGMSAPLWPHYRDALIYLATQSSPDTYGHRRYVLEVLMDLVLSSPGVEQASKIAVIRQLLDKQLHSKYRKVLVSKLPAKDRPLARSHRICQPKKSCGGFCRRKSKAAHPRDSSSGPASGGRHRIGRS